MCFWKMRQIVNFCECKLEVTLVYVDYSCTFDLLVFIFSKWSSAYNRHSTQEKKKKGKTKSSIYCKAVA